MNKMLIGRWLATWVAGFATCWAAAAEKPAKPKEFGFSGCEIFPVDQQISLLRTADLDGDGKLDLALANNARSKITILYNQTGRTNLDQDEKTAGRDFNQLPPDARFRITSIASEKRIHSLVVADLNGDQKPDLAYYGEPKELIIQFNQGNNNWSLPKRIPIEDGFLGSDTLAAGDLNGDGLTDLALLGESCIHLLAQKPGHGFGEPEKIPFSGNLKGIQILDINGDGRPDLLAGNWDSPNPFRFRLQNSSGQLGPELHLAMPPVRSYLAEDLDGDGKTEMITIAQLSGRAQLYGFVEKPAESLAGNIGRGQFAVLPLPKTGKDRRGSVWADINGDQRQDLLVAEPESGLLTVYLQKPDGSMAAARSFPTFTGVSELAVADWEGDGRGEIFLLSTDERQIGVTRLDESGRVPFPTILPLDGRPLAMAAGKLLAGDKPVLALILEQDNKRLLQVRAADGRILRLQPLSDQLKSNPTSLIIQDIDQDGILDLVALIPYEKIKILRQIKDLAFEELDLAPPGGSTEQIWLGKADVDGDGREELLLPLKNFLRAVTLRLEKQNTGSGSRSNWIFHVKEQINGAGSNSRLVAAAPLPHGSNGIPALFLLDAERKVLSVCERDASGVWQNLANWPLPVTDFDRLRPVGLGGPQPNSLAFMGLNSVAWLKTTGQAWELSALGGYESPIKDGFLNDVVCGDLNQDGIKDLVFLETAKNFIDLATFKPPREILPGLRWRVFEERTFRNRRSEFPEPREAVVADFTGDGKKDLAVLVHDRILLYPQE